MTKELQKENTRLNREYESIIEILSDIQTEILNFDKEFNFCDECKTKLLVKYRNLVQRIFTFTQQVID